MKPKKAYEHTYYNKNCFPELRKILCCKQCSDIRRQEGDWRRIKLVEPSPCLFCKTLVQ